MTDPTIQKTWEFDVNNFVLANSAQGTTAAHEDRREMLLGIKGAFTNTAGHSGMTAPWTVSSSSNGTAANTSDNWSTVADLKFRDEDSPGTTFGWIVLRQTGVSATFELLIALESDATADDGAQIYAAVSTGGFNTDGNTTTIPTPVVASDFRVLRNDDGSSLGYWGSGNDGASGSNFQWNVAMSSDGECNRVFIFVNSKNTGFWLFDKPDNPATGWTDPYVAGIFGSNNVTTEQCTYSQFNVAAGMKSRVGGVDVTIFLSSEGLVNAGIATWMDRNQLDNTWPLSEMGIYSETSTFVGRMGTLFDLWWGHFPGTGRYYPQAGTKLYVGVTSMVVPWDGSSLLLTK